MSVDIKKDMLESKIDSVQLDVNGRCDSACWFCPVRYYSRPSREEMSIETFKSILNQINDCIKEGLISDNYTLWLSSYNEFLAYSYVKEALDILREQNKSFTLLTNGIHILEHINTIVDYNDVINGISVNLCAGNSKDYLRYTLRPEKIFDKIIGGLVKLYYEDPERFNREVSIGVNGAYSDQHGKAQTRFYLPDNDTENQVKMLQSLLPYDKIQDMRPLCDRAGSLKEYAIDNSVPEIRQQWTLPIGVEPNGCNGGNRLYGWIHITNSEGLITCCQDFKEEFSFGNLKKDPLSELLKSNRRVNVIRDTLRKLCVNCWFSR